MRSLTDCFTAGRLLSAALVLTLMACGGGEPAQTETATTAPPPPPPPPKAKPLVVKAKDKSTAISFLKNGDALRVSLADGRTLRTQAKGKRHVYKIDGETLLDARETKSGFRIHDGAGAEALRVRVDQEKGRIHVVRADKSLRLVLKIDEDKIHLRSGDDYIGRAKASAKGEAVSVRTKENEVAFRAQGSLSAMYPLLLAEGLSEEERAVLMAELMLRGH